jgi:glycerol-3-phosphate cytidylyltransferase-like family protein
MVKVIKWIVIKWAQIWRTIWFKTANIIYKKNDISDWVYKINLFIDWNIYHWAWCFRKNVEIFESHIFNFNEDIYWKKIEIIILEKIRENKKINNLEELKILIQNDIIIIKQINYNVLTFWSFDLVHEWHKYFLTQSKKYSDKLITILATDKNIEKFKWNKPIFNLKNRIKHISDLNISDIVLWWEENNTLKWIDLYNPQIICLWYDQIWFSNNLKKYIKQNKLNINIKIIRIKPFKKDIYKSSLLKKNL